MKGGPWWVPWIVKAVFNPPKYLDLLAPDGRPDHGKVVGVYAFTVFIGLVLLDKLPPLGHTVALLSVVFGWVAWRAYLKRHQSSSSETITRLEGGERDAGDTRD